MCDVMPETVSKHQRSPSESDNTFRGSCFGRPKCVIRQWKQLQMFMVVWGAGINTTIVHNHERFGERIHD